MANKVFDRTKIHLHMHVSIARVVPPCIFSFFFFKISFSFYLAILWFCGCFMHIWYICWNLSQTRFVLLTMTNIMFAKCKFFARKSNSHFILMIKIWWKNWRKRMSVSEWNERTLKVKREMKSSQVAFCFVAKRKCAIHGMFKRRKKERGFLAKVNCQTWNVITIIIFVHLLLLKAWDDTQTLWHLITSAELVVFGSKCKIFFLNTKKKLKNQYYKLRKKKKRKKKQ